MDRHNPSLFSADGSTDRTGRQPTQTVTGALQRLTNNGKAAIASVMGPAVRSRIKTMIQDKASDAKLQQDIASCTTADQLTDLLMAQLIEPVETEIESASSVHQAALETATREAKEIVIKRLSTVDTHSTQATMDIERAEQKCTDSLEYVGMQLMRIQKAKDRVAMLTQAIDKV